MKKKRQDRDERRDQMKKKRQDRDERRDQMKKKRQDRRWKTREDQREDLKREEASLSVILSNFVSSSPPWYLCPS